MVDNLCQQFVTRTETPFLYCLSIVHIANYISKNNDQFILDQLERKALMVS